MSSVQAPTTYAELLRIPAFRQFMISTTIARLAGQMLQVALVLFILERFHSPALAGLVVFVSIFPGILVSPVAGALLDRFGRVRLMSLDYLVAASGLVAVLGLQATGRLTPSVLLPVMGTVSLTALLGASGSRSMIPLLTPRSVWDRANALDSTSFTSTIIVGPAIAGTLAGLVSPEVALGVTAAGFVLGAAALLGLREPRLSESAGSVLRSAWEGVIYVFASASLRGLAISLSVLNLANGIFAIGMPVLVLTQLHGNDQAVGYMWSILGVASMVAGLLAGRVSSEGRERVVMLVSGLGFALALVVMTASPSLWILGLAMALIGLGMGPFDVALFSLRQRRTAAAWFGRAFAISMSLNYSGVPIGSAMAGPLVGISVRVALGAAALAALVGTLLVLTVPRDDPRAEAERDSAAEGAL